MKKQFHAAFQNGALTLWTSINRNGLRVRLLLADGQWAVVLEVWDQGTRIQCDNVIRTTDWNTALFAFNAKAEYLGF